MTAPVLVNATARHSATVIFMHGLGDTGHGWAGFFQMIKAPHVKYIFPTAPTSPVTLNAGFPMPSWFDIKGLSPGSDEDEAGIKSAAKTVHGWIDAEVKAGIKADRILLGGFSQGGALALYSALTYPQNLAGLILLSTWFPLRDQLKSPVNNGSIPMLQCHGEADPMVIPMIGQLTAERLKELNPDNHTFKTYPGMGHSSDEKEMQDVKAFLDQHLTAV